jgi:ribosome-binding factor A
MAEYRLERLGKLIQEKIGAMIVEGRIKDPRVDPFLSISKATVSKDLSFADIYISSFEPSAHVRKGVEGLQSAAGFIQSQLNMKMHLRQTPKLRFHEDIHLRDSYGVVKTIEDLSHEGST